MAEIDITEQDSEQLSIDIESEQVDPAISEVGGAASLVAVDQGNDPVDAYVKATESGDMGEMLNTFESSVTEDRTAMMDSFVGINTPEVIQKDAEDFTNDMSGANGILGPLVQQIKSMPSSVGMSDAQVKEIASVTMQRQALARFQPEGVVEGFGDFAGVLVPKRHAATVREISSKLGFTSTVSQDLGILFDPSDELDQMRNIGISLEGEEKAEYIKAVTEAVDSSSDNNFIKSRIMDAIFGGGTTAFESGFEMLDLAFTAQVFSATVKTGTSLYKTGSALNISRKMKAADTAAEIIVKASGDPAAAKALGVTKADIGDALNPLINGESAKVLEGASEDLTAEIVHMIALQDARFASVQGLSREGVLDKETAAQVMRAAEIAQMKKPGVSSAKITSADETGFKLEWFEQRFDEVGKPITSQSGKPFVDKQTKQVDFKLNDQGKIESPLDEYSTAVNKLDTNARMSGRLRNWFVHTVETLARVQEKTSFSFDNMMRDAFKGLKKDGAARVDYVLSQGAKDGKQYTVAELMNSGVGSNSVKLSAKEAKAYVGVRNIVNHMYSLKNKQITDGFSAMGVKLVDGLEGVVPARVFDSAESALKNWRSIKSDSLWINVADDGLKSGDVPVQLLKLSNKGELTEKMVAEAYEKGYVLAKNHSTSTFFKRGNHSTQWSFVKKESAISPRGQQVINKLPGYIPKQRTNGYFFIKSKKQGVLSGAGKDFETGHTVAWSDSAKSADDWIAAQDDPSKFVKLFDREMAADQQAIEITATHGGMYSGARKSTELPFVGESKAEFADSFEAMQHYINHIGRQYPASLYRLGSEQRLLEIAEGIGVKGATGLHDVLGKALASNILKNSKEYKMLEDIHDQVSFINMIPTEAELNWAKRFEDLGKSLEGPILNKIPGWNKVPKFFYNKASQSTHPADLIRGFTFNHLLGMYNPAQLLVQFSGAMVSFSVSPVHFTRTLHKSVVGWPMLDQMMADPRNQARVLAWMRGKGAMKEFAEDYELWAKSGYRESVVNGNADYTSVFMKNLPYDAGILQKAMANHTIFYKMGELANTRTAFATAVERYKDLKKIKRIDPDDAEALDAISKEAEALRLNMSRANQADINKGWKSVPLQFQQVITKYFEKLLPKGFGGTDEFTGAEKFRLLAIPTALTGAVGIPLGQAVMVEMLDLMGIDETELSPEQTQINKFGAIGFMMQSGGLNVDLSSRMTLGGDVLKKSFEALTGSRSLWQWLGASSSVADRYFRNGQYLAEAFDLSVLENDDVDLDSMKFMASVLRDIAVDIPTVSRNIKQYSAYLLTHSTAFKKDGKYLFDLETMNDRTAFMAMWGFQPQEISEIYEIDKEINDGRAAFQLFGDTDADIIRRVLSTHVLANDISVEHQALGAQMINSIMKKYGPMEAAELMSAVWEKANSKRFDQNDLLIKFLLESEKRMQEGLDVMNTTMARKLQQLREGNE